MKHRFLLLFLAGPLLWGAPPAARADIISGAATGEVFFSTAGFGVEGTTGVVPIPLDPGNLSFTVPGTRGSGGFLPETWALGTDPFVFIANTAATPFLNQDANLPASAGAGLAQLRANFTVVYTLDASGLSARTLMQFFGVGGLLGTPGGPGGFAEFEFDINFTHSGAGFLGDLNGLINFTGSGPVSGGVGDSLALPSLSPGTLTLSGFFALRVDDNPGDGVVTEFGVRSIPEPGALLLLGAAGAGAGVAAWRRRRAAALADAMPPE